MEKTPCLAKQASDQIYKEGISAFFDSTPIEGLLVPNHPDRNELVLEFRDGSRLFLPVLTWSWRSRYC
jgi:hypothetical protein